MKGAAKHNTALLFNEIKLYSQFTSTKALPQRRRDQSNTDMLNL